MPLDLVTIPCLTDNYAFLLHDGETGLTLLADAPESWPVQAVLEQRGWRLSHVLITHHHADHIDGLAELRELYRPKVIGAAADAHRLPPLDAAVHGGDRFEFGSHAVEVIDVPGHTLGHVAYYLPDAHAAFTGDSLMALGCGRVFEGTMAQMWQSLCRLAELPENTVICSGHEYTAANGRFAATIEPDNPALARRRQAVDAARAEGRATVPSLLSEELATNPFLRAGRPEVKAAIGMPDASDADAFTEIRTRKDKF